MEGTISPKYSQAMPLGVMSTPPTAPGYSESGSKAVKMYQVRQRFLRIVNGSTLRNCKYRSFRAFNRSSFNKSCFVFDLHVSETSFIMPFNFLPNTNQTNLPWSLSKSLGVERWEVIIPSIVAASSSFRVSVAKRFPPSQKNKVRMMIILQ